MDLFDKIDRLMKGSLGQFSTFEPKNYFIFPKLEGPIGPHMKFQGKDVLVWSLNNYLGLANHPEVRAVDAEAAAKFGLGTPMGARPLTGNTDFHEELESKLSEFVQKEDTFLLNYGFQGMVSIIQALTDRKDVIVYDALAHGCIIDGMMLSLAKRFVYAHNDIEQLEDRLNKALQIVEKTGGGILVITEGLFGMKGDTGKLDKIIALKEKYPFRLLVDDAHGFGIMGKSGIGTGEYYGVQDKIDVLFNTFAKSMALVGAFVSGDKKVINFLRYNLRSQIYAKSLPLPIIIGALKRLELLKNAHKERKHLWDISTALQTGLRNNGFYLGDINSPITPLYMSPSPEITMYPILDLRDNYHIFVSAVVYPVIEKGIIIFRMIPTAEHSFEDVNYTIQSFGEIGNKIATNYYTPALAN